MRKFARQTIFAFALIFTFTFIINAQTQITPTDDEQPKVVKAAAINRYPIGNFKGAYGNVLIKIKINAAGAVISAIPITGHPVLRPLCVNAAKNWVFEPISDKKRERMVTLTFNFQKPETEVSGVYFKPPYTIEYINAEVR